jgi:hypothetical protein
MNPVSGKELNMGKKLDEHYSTLITALSEGVGDHLRQMEQRVSRGDFPPRVDSEDKDVSPAQRHHRLLHFADTLRVSLGIPQIERPMFVEVEPGKTWEGVLADFKRATHPDTSAAPFEIASEVRGLNPFVVPGIYQIFLWSDPSGDDDGPEEVITRYFAECDAGGWLVPVIQWFATCSTVYHGVMAPLGGDTARLGKRLLTFTNYQLVRLALDPRSERGAGPGPYVGAKLIA